MSESPFRPFETALDLDRTLGQLRNAVAGADDGELFLERRRGEALVLDDGRIRTASYDASEGFGLRAVRGEVAGYAHSTEISEQAITRAVETARLAVGDGGGVLAPPPTGTNRKLYTDIEQKSTSHNPRSTVGTITEIYDYLRLMFARVGEPRCPTHDLPLAAQTISQMVDTALALPEGTKLMLLAPVVKDRKGEHVKLLEQLASQGYIRARIDGEVCDLSDPPPLDLHKKHTIEVVVDRFKVKDGQQQRLAESFETALEMSGGVANIAFISTSLALGMTTPVVERFSASNLTTDIEGIGA